MIVYTARVSKFLALASDRRLGKKFISDAIKAAHYMAWDDWIAGRLSTSLAHRFRPSAFSIYAFSRRSRSYEQRQRRAFGQARPYFSPRQFDFAQLAQAAIAVAQGKAAAVTSLLRATERIHRGAHLSTLVQRAGGWRVRVTGKNRIKSRLTLPGAKILNRVPSPFGQKYRKQLLDMTRGRDRGILISAIERHYRKLSDRFYSSLPMKKKLLKRVA